MKTLLHICFTATALAIPAAAQNDAPAATPSQKQPDATRTDSGHDDTRDKKRDYDAAINPTTEKEFVMTACKKCAMEVKVAQLGVDKAEDAKVKELAQKLVTDHTAANSSLKTVAAALNIELPDHSKDKPHGDDKPRGEDKARIDDKTPDEHKAKQKHEDLTQLTGKEFDRAFLQNMAKCHEKSIALYEAGLKVAKSEQVIAYIDKTLPVLRTHAQKIKEVQTETGLTATPGTGDDFPTTPRTAGDPPATPVTPPTPPTPKE